MHLFEDRGHPSYTPRLILTRYWIADHAWIRALVPNFHKVDDDLYRSNHPGRRQLEKAKALGVRSVLSLRDPDCMPSRLERAICDRLGLELRFVRLRTVFLPSTETMKALLDSLRDMPKPMLVHCKSGADRTGLAVTLHRHVIKGEPLEEARKSLHWTYGHFPTAKTNVVHRMLDAYAAENSRTGVDFGTWLDTSYDPVALNQTK